MHDEYNLATEERLTIERKEKFANYIGTVKSKSLKLDGDLDEQFQVKAKFKKAAEALAAKAAAGDMVAQIEILLRGRAMQNAYDSDDSD